MSTTSPLVPTVALQFAAVIVLIVAAWSGRAANREHPAIGILCVLSLFVAGLLLAVLVYRMGH